jgi:hypothetical protein
MAKIASIKPSNPSSNNALLEQLDDNLKRILLAVPVAITRIIAEYGSPQTPSEVSIFKGKWITPREQLGRLIRSLTDVLADVNALPLDVNHLIAMYAWHPILISWYVSLESLNILPEYIPPLESRFVDCVTADTGGDLNKMLMQEKLRRLFILTLFAPVDHVKNLREFDVKILRPFRRQNLDERAFCKLYCNGVSGDEPYPVEPHWQLSCRVFLQKKSSGYDEYVKTAFPFVSSKASLAETVIPMFFCAIAIGKCVYKNMSGQKMSWACTAISEKSKRHSQVDLSHFNQNGLQVYEGDYRSKDGWYLPVMKL